MRIHNNETRAQVSMCWYANRIATKQNCSRLGRLVFRNASTFWSNRVRIFGCIPEGCAFLLLCNQCFFVKFNDLILLSSDIRSEGSIAIVKKLRLRFFDDF